jgi:hypothetical protein
MPERGGTTTQSGILYQNSVAALYLGRLCDATPRPERYSVVGVRVEAPTAVDDIVVTFADGGVTYIQAKENIRDDGEAWAGLWGNFEDQFNRPDFKRGRDRLLLHIGEPHNEHHALRELCERAINSVNAAEWAARLTTAQQTLLRKIKPHLGASLSGDADLLLVFFSHIDVEIANLTQIERDAVPRWMPAGGESPIKLFRLLRDRVGGAARLRGAFTADELRASLEEDGIRLDPQPTLEELRDLARACGAVLRQHKHTFGNTGRHLKRAVVDDIVRWARESREEDDLALLLDQAGMGKTIVMRDVLLALEEAGETVFAIKADQQVTGIGGPEDLRASLRLPDSVERVVGRLAAAGRVLVLVDQIDALSLSMARDQRSLNIALDLVARLRLIGGVRVLVSCRVFDLNNDPSLRQQLGGGKRFSIPELTEEEIRGVLSLIGAEYDGLSPATRQLLKTPLHLDLFALATAGRPATALSAPGAQGLFSLQDLYALLWRNVVRKGAPGAPPVPQRERVLAVLADYMNREQRTSAPTAALGDPALDDAANWLASEGVLSPYGVEWTFLHQTFFDYCYAKGFVERSESLSEAVLRGDQGLFARPQIVQVLGYLRGVNTQVYLHELGMLLTAEDLRAHLRDLVIRWFGALPAPTEEEWVLARRMLVDHGRRARLMAAMSGNVGWFGYLKEATIPGLLDGDDETIDTLAIPYLISMLGTAQAEVFNMVGPYLGRNERWDRRLTWMLQSVREWKTPEAVALFERAFGALQPDQIKHVYQLDDVAKADPRAGCRLARVAFDKVLEDYLAAGQGDETAYLFSLATFLEHYNGSTMDETLKTTAQREPEYFLEQMLPWLERVVELTAEPEVEDDDSPFYRSDEFSFLGWYSDSFVVKHQLIEAFVAALTALAQTDADKFKATTQRLAASTRTTSQRLLAHVYRAVPESYADDAYRFLTGDRRRLQLGDHDQYDTRQLLKAIYPHLSAAQRDGIEAFILSYNYIRKYAKVNGLRWRGIDNLHLLQSVPRELLTERGERGLRELEHKFPGERASDSPTRSVGGFVGPPISEDRARKMSDSAWLRAMAKYSGGVQHKDFLKGGAYELGGVLVTLTNKDPERFYKLALNMPDGIDDSYVQAIINGLAESNAPSELLFEVIRRFASHPERDIRRVNGWVLEKRARRDGLPEDIIALLEGYVRGPAGEDEGGWIRQDERGQARRDDGLNSGPYISYLNSDRGAAFKAMMRAFDAKGDDAKARKWEMIEFAVGDDSTALRAGAVEELLYMLHEDRERAIAAFERLMDGHPALLRSHFTQEFLRYGLYRHYERVRPYIVELMNGDHESLQQRGAELACIAAISPVPPDSGEGRGDADALAESTITGPAAWRRGAARVFAGNVTTEVSARCVDTLRRLMDDDDKDVRQSINGVFHRLRDEHFLQLRDLIEAFAASRSLSKETHWFTEFLWEHGVIDPSLSLSVVEKLLANEGREVEEPAFKITGGEELVRLVLRIYTDPSAAALRGRAMDIFDRLMDVYTGQAQMVLGEWDRLG